MQQLEAEGVLDREVEFLPPTRRDGRAPARAGRAWSRPELAVLLAYAKRSVVAALLAIRPARLARTSSADLARYFPPHDRRAVRPSHRGAPAAARADRDDRRRTTS